MTRVSISLGAHAVPAVKDALAHAAAHPEHDPIVVFPAEVGGTVSWVCFGELLHSADPAHFCAGDPR